MTSEKARLYQSVDQLREQLSLCIEQSIDAVSLAHHSPRIEVEHHPFKTPGLCGIAMVGDKVDTIVLNSNRSYDEQNFDCCHEIMHLFLHRQKQDSFNCFAKAKPQQDTFLEWQANEGAAQFLVPYQDFIPKFLYFLNGNTAESHSIQKNLADIYHVTEQVINNRISNLSYEIDQYRNGVPIDRINLLSRKQQQRVGIHPTRYNSVCEFGLAWDAVIG